MIQQCILLSLLLQENGSCDGLFELVHFFVEVCFFGVGWLVRWIERQMWMMFVVSLCLFFLCENIHTRFLLRFNQTLAIVLPIVWRRYRLSSILGRFQTV